MPDKYAPRTEFTGGTHDLADALIDRLPIGAQSRLPKGGCAIDAKHVPPIADAVQQFIANVVAGLIDAGSERDAVNEDEELRDTLTTVLTGWSTSPGLPPVIGATEAESIPTTSRLEDAIVLDRMPTASLAAVSIACQVELLRRQPSIIGDLRDEGIALGNVDPWLRVADLWDRG